MTEHLTFDLGAPLGDLVSSNRYHGQYWGATHANKVAWRDGVATLARAEKISKAVKLRPAQVRFTFPVPDRRHRDPSNYVGTVVKWCVDGLVIAGTWPHDGPEWVRVLEPILELHGRAVLLDLWLLEAP